MEKSRDFGKEFQLESVKVLLRLYMAFTDDLIRQQECMRRRLEELEKNAPK